MNRFLTATLVATTLFTPLTKVSAQTAFPDVPDDYIYADAIEYVKNEGIVGGFTDGTFKPEQTITRAEFTKIIMNALFDVDSWNRGDYRDNAVDDEICWLTTHDLHLESGFSDVPAYRSFVSNHDELQEALNDGESLEYYNQNAIVAYEGDVFSKYTCPAKELGVLSGYTDGTFKPENPITVGEASKIISNAYKFTDVQSGPEGDVFKPFVDALAEKNALPVELVYIDNDLTRGQMAEIIFRLETENTEKQSVEYRNLHFTSFLMDGTMHNCNDGNLEIEIPVLAEYSINEKSTDTASCSAIEAVSRNHTINLNVYDPGVGCLEYDNIEYIGKSKFKDLDLYRAEMNGNYVYDMTLDESQPVECQRLTSSIRPEQVGGQGILITCSGNVELCDKAVLGIDIRGYE